MMAEEDGVVPSVEDDEFELALARLEWAKEAHCLDIPEQARAVRWHVEACDEARAPASADGRAQE
jgi:hypothetical protein